MDLWLIELQRAVTEETQSCSYVIRYTTAYLADIHHHAYADFHVFGYLISSSSDKDESEDAEMIAQKWIQ